MKPHQLWCDKGLPAGMFLRQPVRHSPPRARVQPHAQVAGEDFNIFGVWIDVAGRLYAALPRHHTVSFGVNAGCRHSRCGR